MELGKVGRRMSLELPMFHFQIPGTEVALGWDLILEEFESQLSTNHSSDSN